MLATWCDDVAGEFLAAEPLRLTALGDDLKFARIADFVAGAGGKSFRHQEQAAFVRPELEPWSRRR